MKPSFFNTLSRVSRRFCPPWRALSPRSFHGAQAETAFEVVGDGRQGEVKRVAGHPAIAGAAAGHPLDPRERMFDHSTHARHQPVERLLFGRQRLLSPHTPMADAGEHPTLFQLLHPVPTAATAVGIDRLVLGRGQAIEVRVLRDAGGVVHEVLEDRTRVRGNVRPVAMGTPGHA